MVGSDPWHEHDNRWTAVDQYASSHLIPSTKPINKALAKAADVAEKSGLPDIAVSPLQGQFLSIQCHLVNAKNVLEVGTLGGYSAIWFASTSPDIKVTTVEIDPDHAAVARKCVDAAGVGDRVEILVGSGVDVVPKIKEEVAAGRRPKFDLVFIDADKVNNLTYLNHSIEMSRQRGCIIVDNVVRKGLVAVAEEAEKFESVRGSRAVLEAAAKDSRLHVTLIQTVGEKNYDGMLICSVK